MAIFTFTGPGLDVFEGILGGWTPPNPGDTYDPASVTDTRIVYGNGADRIELLGINFSGGAGTMRRAERNDEI